MIKILLSKDKYFYDMHSLVKAFYQEQEVSVEACDEKKIAQLRSDIYDKTTILSAGQTESQSKISLLQSNKNEITIIIQFPSDSGEKSDTEGSTDLQKNPTVEVNASTNGTDTSVATEKNALKRDLYRLLSKQTGRELPWGALTGIRPTKIATQMLADKKDDISIINYLKNAHFVSDEKATLSVEIAHRERDVLAKRDYENGYSLYVGIPFCPTRCAYCSFAAYSLRAPRYAAMVDDYLDALEKELAATARIMQGARLDTVYLGGGTPTSLTAAQTARLLDFLQENFDFSQVAEFTVEAGRPDSILDDPEKLSVLKRHDVDRICVNPQTFSQRTLDKIGRDHTTKETITAFHAAREAGFDNINMDIILGLPGETVSDVARTMSAIAQLRPDDLTVHSLALKRGSKMQERLAQERELARRSAPDTLNADADGSFSATDKTAMYYEMYRVAEDGARAMGLTPYYLYRQKNMTGNMENTGFARAGKEGLTNILGMEEVQSIVACGCGAIAKRVFKDGLIRRCANVKDLPLYIANVDEMIARKEALFTP